MATEMILPVFFCLHIIGWAAVLLVANLAWAHYTHANVLAARNGALWAPLESASGAVGGGGSAGGGDGNGCVAP
jgi:hypothetical protein